MIWTFGGARSPGRGNMPFAAATFLAGLVHRNPAGTLTISVTDVTLQATGQQRGHDRS
jgi:hypothetical protein